MSPKQIEEIAMQVVSEELPQLEQQNQSYFYGFVKELTETIIIGYDINKIDSEEYLKKLMLIDLERLKSALSS
ncbi:hypothetical protein ACVBAX_13335 [Robertmurraya sp. GLU-23]